MIVVRSPKSPGVAFILSFLFGPFGMFYSTVTGALVILGIDFLLIFISVLTLGIGSIFYIFTWIGGIIWAMVAASNYNSTLAVVAPAQTQAQTVNVTVNTPGFGPYMQPGQYSGMMPQSGQYPQPGMMPQPGPYQQSGQFPQPGQYSQPGMMPPQYGPYPQPGPMPNQYPQSGTYPQSGAYPQDGPRPNQYT